MKTGNKGEWSEVYTLFRLIADKNLVMKNGKVLPIVKVIRKDGDNLLEYSYDDTSAFVYIKKNQIPVTKIALVEFENEANFLLNELRLKSSASFEIPQTEAFMNKISCYNLRAQSSDKKDISLVIHDNMAGDTELGFSIKSQLGNPSTLLNASKATNFIYKLNNSLFSRADYENINAIDSKNKIKDRLKAIEAINGKIAFHQTENSVFQNNLILIDSSLPLIIAELLLLFFSTDSVKVADLISDLEVNNPAKYDFKYRHPFYTYKIKRFLTDVALGMMPSKVWTGNFDATGGYLVVNKSGDLDCYHIYNRNEFEDYLLENTRFETASSTKHDFGLIFEQNGDLFFKLNLQIRFL